MNNMFDHPCAVCHNYGCVQEHKWCYMDDGVLARTALELLEEMLRRAGHTRAPYPYLHAADMMTTEARYIYPSASHTTIYQPTFNGEESFMPNDVDALAGRMQDAYITPPAHPIDTWMGEGGASLSAQQCGPNPSYSDIGAPWQVEGYTGAPQNTDPGEDIRYTGQHANLFELETSFSPPPSAPIPVPASVPSISVVEHLEQGTYAPQQPVKGTPVGPIHFNGDLGVSLASLDALAHGGEPAFDTAASIGAKASIRFELPQFQGHSMQVRVRHGVGKGRGGRPITLREMGATVFEELKKLMEYAEKRGEALRHRGSAVDIERVVLLRVDHVSKGSIQPILGILNSG